MAQKTSNYAPPLPPPSLGPSPVQSSEFILSNHDKPRPTSTTSPPPSLSSQSHRTGSRQPFSRHAYSHTGPRQFHHIKLGFCTHTCNSSNVRSTPPHRHLHNPTTTIPSNSHIVWGLASHPPSIPLLTQVHGSSTACYFPHLPRLLYKVGRSAMRLEAERRALRSPGGTLACSTGGCDSPMVLPRVLGGP